MTTHIAVIADDLSGAIALGAEFRRAGLVSLVLGDTTARVPETPQTDVLIVNTDSRNDPIDIAREKNRAAVLSLKNHRPDWTVKKIDSLLRGHIGSEVETILTATGKRERCIVIPASPRSGRTTVNGYQLLAGKPIGQQMHGLDSTAGQIIDSVADVLAQETNLATRLLPLELVRRSMDELTAFVAGSDEPILIADAETQEDMKRAVLAAAGNGIRLFVGTYGLGEAIVASEMLLRSTRPILAIAGSTSVSTHRQVVFAENNSGCAVLTLALNIDDLAQPDTYRQALYRQELQSHIDAGRDVILRTLKKPEDIASLLQTAKQAGWEDGRLGRHIERYVAGVVRPLLSKIGGLAISGGSTASAVFRSAGAAAFLVEGPEVIPASPLIRVLGGECDRLLCLTKPGSFGQEADLLEMMKFLRLYHSGNSGNT